MKTLTCYSTGSVIGSDEWKAQQVCGCVRCVQFRGDRQTNHDASKQRQYISVKFEIDLPLKQDQVEEAVGLLESLLGVLKQSIKTPPADVATLQPSTVSQKDDSE